MLLAIFIILSLYVFMIIRYAFGWHEIKEILHENSSKKVSVIIALRNEESEISRLLQGLESQVYASDKLEFILVNDHSTDNTIALLEKSDLKNLQILNMPEGEFGKKNAISKAVSMANGDIILSSDADCIFTPNWVRTMVSYFSNNNVYLVSGPVIFHKKQGILQSLQALEFTSLIGSGAGAIGVGNAIFCNGANMAYRKSIFLEVNNFKSATTVSGDDVFLLHSIKKKYPKSIVFAKNRDAMVTTYAMQSFKGFINQRKRWVAKSSSYKDYASIYSSFLVFFTNLIGFSLLFLLLYDSSYLFCLLYYFGIKFLVDLFLLYPVLSFFKQKDLIKWILPLEIFYSIYIVLIVFLSLSNTFEWKGRIHKK